MNKGIIQSDNATLNSTEVQMFGTPQGYRNPTPGKITIINHGLSSLEHTLTSEIVSMIKGLNMNAIMAQFSMEHTTEDGIRNSFKELNGKDLKLVIRKWFPHTGKLNVVSLEKDDKGDDIDPAHGWVNNINGYHEMAETVLNIINEPDVEDNLGGWFVCDEPSYCVFWRMLEYKDAIISVYQDKGINNPHIIYANLFPSPSFEQANGLIKCLMSNGEISPDWVYLDTILGKTNEAEEKREFTDDYYNEYFSVFNPSVWSYDYYAFQAKKVSIPGGPTYDYYDPILRDTFFRAMMRIKKIADLTGRPFWAYVRSLFHTNAGFPYARPTVGTMRFAAFCALAFGAKGIVYWETFDTIRKSVYDAEFYDYKTAAPIVVIVDDYDDEGNIISDEIKNEDLPYYYKITDIYDMVKTVNMEISKVSSLLYESTFVEGGAYPNKPNAKDPGIDVISLPFGNITEIEGLVGFIITKLKNIDGRYVYVVISQDYKNPQKVNIKFTEDVYVQIAGETNKLYNEIERTLEAGAWLVLIEENTKKSI